MNKSSSRRHLLGWLVLAAATLFYLATLRPGHRAGDFAMYVQHTANMAEGRAYAETGYFQNPASTSVGTTSYPPGLPVLLLPIYAAAGFDLVAMKALMSVLFVLALVIFWLMTRDNLTAAFAAAMLFDVAFSPYLWGFKDNVESDFPFLLPLFLALWLMQRSSKRGSGVFGFVGLGAVMYAAVAIRSIGLVLPITLLLYDLVEGRRKFPSPRFWIATSTLVVMMMVQAMVLPLESGSYSSAFLQQVGSPGQFVQSMITNAKFYILACAGRLLLSNGHGTLWADVLLAICIVPFLAGLVARIRSRIGVLEVFFVVYAGILLVWPFRQPNYLIPLIPLLSYYIFVGLESLAKRFIPRSPGLAAAVALGVLVLTYGLRYQTLDFRHVPHDVMSEASIAFYEHVKTSTPEHAVILSRVPREVAFFTGRRSTPPNLPGDNRDTFSAEEESALRNYIREAGVDFVAAGPRGPQFHREVIPLWDLTDARPGVFARVFENDEWRLYRVVRSIP